MSDKPQLITGKKIIDDRGQLSFINDLDMHNIKRFYIVKNHVAGFVRAWHAHQKEAKYAIVLRGAAIFAAIPMLELERIAADHCNQENIKYFIPKECHRICLGGDVPAVFYIPPGYGNGFKTLTADTEIMFFSTSTLSQSKNDDIRFSSEFFRNVWEVEER